MLKGLPIAAAGELLVEFVSHTKGCALEQIGAFSGPYPSGAPAIFLDQAARMGASTRMYGGVGDDGFGRTLLLRLQNDHVDTEGVAILKGRSTGTAFVSYYDDGSRDFIFHLTDTAADGFTFDPATWPNTPILLHISAASLGSPSMRHTIMSAMDHVLTHGGKICCDPNARPELMTDPDSRAALWQVIEQSHVLMPSTSDLDFLFPDLNEAAAVDRLLQAKAEIIVIKRGAGGVTVVGNGERHDFAGHNVTEVDPTGAGDCFCGTFVALLTQGQPLAEAARRANAAGAIAVTRRGPMEGNSTPQEITAFLAAVETDPQGSKE